MKQFPRYWSLFVAGLTAVGAASANVKPHNLFTDHMVLQRDAKVAVWGTGDENEKVSVSINGQEESTTVSAGKWMVKVGPFPAGGPHTLTIAGKNTVVLKDVLVGEVWICSGQSNMEWSLQNTDGAKEAIEKSKNENIRLFTVPKRVEKGPIADVNAKWVKCDPGTSKNFSAVGYHFGRKLESDLKIPIGLINTSWGGTPAEAWTSRDALSGNERLSAEILESFAQRVKDFPKTQEQQKKRLEAFKKDPKNKGKRPPAVAQQAMDQNSPAALYNGMLAPLVPYGIRGAIWYQGESNAGRADQYFVLFPEMIKDWRRVFGQGDFPFLFVQLAPWDPRKKPVGVPESTTWPELRESQRYTWRTVPNTGMAVITDVGDMTDIHPRNKKPVGERLAASALQDVYKKPGEGHSPDFEKLTIDGEKAIVEFRHVGGGLEVKDGPVLHGWALAGEDHKFVSAEAKLDGNRVVVTAPGLAKPVAVRFGWADFPVGNLYNKEGFPATPFRTDDFPLVTAPKIVRKVN